MMLCLIQCCMDIVARVLRVVQAREVVPHIVPSTDTHVVVILVPGQGLGPGPGPGLRPKVMMMVVLKVVEVDGVEEPSECKNIDMLKKHIELESNKKKNNINTFYCIIF